MSAIDSEALEQRIAILSKAMGWHLGSVELVDVSAQGVVTIRFLGACKACPLKPVTLTTTVERMLLDVEGVTGVEAVGVYISDEARRSLAVIQ